MQDLKAIIKLLSAQKLKQIEIITEDVELSEKTKALYDGIKDGTYTNDEEAAADLYGEDPKNDTYRKLKYRLKERILNTLFFIDIQNYSKSAYEKALDRNYKNWALSRILLEKGLRGPSMNLLEKSLKASLKYDITDLNCLILKALKKHYGLYNYNAYKFDKYKKLEKKYFQLHDYERQAEEFYTVLGHNISSSKSYNYTTQIKTIEKEMNLLYDKVKDEDSYYLQFYMLNSIYFLNMIKRDNSKLNNICDVAIGYFKGKQGFPNMALFSFYQKKGISLLALNDYTNAILNFKKCLNFKPREGSLNWQYLHNYIFTAQIIMKDYQAAYETISLVLNSKHFNKIDPTFKQPWYIKEAFIHFLIKIGKINPDESSVKSLREFRMTRFLNDVDQVARDKRGLNITINIIQMLFLIIDEEFDQVLDKLAALKQYNFRYLKRPEYVRPRSFIKMLLKIPEANYKREEIVAKASKHYKNLVKNKSSFSEHEMSLEIIPYEQLWEEILSVFE